MRLPVGKWATEQPAKNSRRQQGDAPGMGRFSFSILLFLNAVGYVGFGTYYFVFLGDFSFDTAQTCMGTSEASVGGRPQCQKRGQKKE